MLKLGSVYLIVKDFKKSIYFYEKLMCRKVTSQNMERFAQFIVGEQNISIMNAYFDTENPNKTIHKGEYDEEFDDLVKIAENENTHKCVLNFYIDNLNDEWNRIYHLGITDRLTKIKYVNNVMPYYYFQLMDPDGNIIEITGNYSKDVS